MCLNTELYKKNVKILLTTVTSRAKLVKSQYELNLMPEISAIKPNANNQSCFFSHLQS